MQKLIELLNEAKPLKKYKEYWYIWNEIYLYTYAEDYWASKSRNITLDVISKSFWFIKWLVKNDKIDWLKFYGENEFTPIWVNAKSDIDQVYSIEEQILMTLSISDTPIEDLISYLG